MNAPHLAPLTYDGFLFLGEGMRDPDVPRLPDGRRHYNAVHELLDRGFTRYGEITLEVTDAGRAYYNAGR